MVCIPCIVIPFVLWFFHRYCKPWITKIFPNWFQQQKIEEGKPPDFSAGDTKLDDDKEKVEQNGVANGVCNRQTVMAGDDSKKDK